MSSHELQEAIDWFLSLRIDVEKYCKKYKLKSDITRWMITVGYEKLREVLKELREEAGELALNIVQSLYQAYRHGPETFELAFAAYMTGIIGACQNGYESEPLCEKVLPAATNIVAIAKHVSGGAIRRARTIAALKRDQKRVRQMYMEFKKRLGLA